MASDTHAAGPRVATAETNGSDSVVEILSHPGDSTPMHVPQNADEHFLVLQGTARIVRGNETGSPLVRRLVLAKDDPAKQRIRAWLSGIDDERLFCLGLTSEDIAALRGTASLPARATAAQGIKVESSGRLRLKAFSARCNRTEFRPPQTAAFSFPTRRIAR